MNGQIPGTAPAMMKSDTLKARFGESAWFALLGAGMALGTGAFAYVLIYGHTHEFSRAWEPPWGILIAAYEFFVLAGAGIFLLIGLAALAGGRGRNDFGGQACKVAVLAMLIGLAALAIELSQPMRLAIKAVLTADFFREVTQAAALFMLCLLLLWGASVARRRKSRMGAALLALGGFIASFAGMAQVNRILALFGSGTEWLAPHFYPDRVLAALLSGGGLLLLALQLRQRLAPDGFAGKNDPPLDLVGRWQVLLIVLFAVYLFWDVISGLATASPSSRLTAFLLLRGPLGINFWIFELLVGLAAPFLLLILRPSRPGRFIAAGLFLTTGQFFHRFDRLVAVQFGSLDHRALTLAREGLVSLAPCLPKLFVVIGTFSCFLFACSLGAKLLPLSAPK